MFQQLTEGFRDWLISTEAKQPAEKEQRPRSLNDISLEFVYSDLHDATNGFSNKLGSGAAGSVYRGTLRSGTEVAVKVLQDGGELGGFEEEVRLLSRFRHPNLVTLLGWGAHKDEKYLVYEFLPGGDASIWLEKCRSSNGKVSFPWQQRLQLALDAASGLSHLMNSTPKAFHRDIKPANILLDQAGTAKMSDFGLAGTLKETGRMHLTVKNISGTPGYACPWYIQSGHVNEQSEVYSFGTVLLELIINQPPALSGPTGDIIYPLLEKVQPAAPGALERTMRSLDATAGWPHPLVDQFSALALQSVNMKPERRPPFEHIVQALRQMCAAAGLRGRPQPPPTTGGGGYGQDQSSAQPIVRQEQSQQFLAEVVLSCVSCQTVSPSTLSPMERSMGFKVDFSSGRWAAAVGRQHQPEFFERLLPKDALARISRTHFELFLESPAGGLMLRKVSTNPLFLNDKPLAGGAAAPLGDMARISFENPAAPTATTTAPTGVATDEPYSLMLCVRCRSGDQVSREGSHPSVRDGSTVAGSCPGAVVSAPFSGPGVLECVKTIGVDLQSLSVEDRVLALPMNQTLEVGRQHQPSFFEKLLKADASWLAFISRSHLRVSLQRETSMLQVENLSSNPVMLQGRLLMKGQTDQLSEGCRLIFVAKDASFLEFVFKRGGA
eukprot:gb/GFBE01037610.1/.p1 GENE.gb/GFBE01037610.1/~~gb/GFBE01037610.1/.p1  ORF type:complete len:665 (+),score=133.12 gb/GFBE01037610.1/:1-1995(+)